MRPFINIFRSAALICCGVLINACSVERTDLRPPNILFIAVDDLRPELGCYGSEIAFTPNLDLLAGEGILFNRAYCQQAICSPSRASIMTGARPESIGVIENYTDFRVVNPDIVTLPQLLIEHGYETVNIGKIYHGRFYDPDHSWSREPFYDRMPEGRLVRQEQYQLEKNRAILEKNREIMTSRYGDVAGKGLVNGPAFECADVADNAYRDGYNTDVAIATLKELAANKETPFFLALGFYKPHLNWIAPKRYWDLYDREIIPMATQNEAPEDGAEMGLHPSFELRVRHGIPEQGEIDAELGRTLKHAYLACVSYIDAQIGRMISALEEEGVRDNTIIMIWGDHGWHLGEMGIWGKATNYEIATRVPLMVWTPELPKQNRGRKTDALVELLDLYPTLCELAGIRKPDHLEGKSLVPILEDPDRLWDEVAFSQFPTPALREWAANPLSPEMRETFFGPLIREVEEWIIRQQGNNWDRELFENRLMGYSMRTDRYRFIFWKDFTEKDAAPLYFELYDHETDPGETRNIAPENPELVKSLLLRFQKEW